ncbi:MULTISPECIES: 50S ribosomal protein L18 [Cycloclasticus]|jgi:large subunit ribosomal protein L18|uniref:Large ribosomal subunit protein uL18 n=2 Tax=Cycloclasticus TaxID=34067 RepID=S5TE35_9GAMM|nr:MULTISPECIES: 50S ribosomal protein L18 [Cycloclasticus]AFT67733.1 50S ribosomal protein L18 [Cycloclasticus sp. P1]AGS39097.1 50S ribosomal protein L18 [Cycloclasticus zancles 78-ME]ATI02723.1 50S ribosomal protein L18 [Cycloclasticus sp. PY97N]EPD13467.1 50S ribosomal protein L18 [Cycloclasticus pugetii]MBV1897788.1 50S ribosomal protein L18 [Cycloclasticus sp.]|tara:strand:- start:37 stop:390 length:354 start_codon:yes stop_codon:yes gene_type:complete
MNKKTSRLRRATKTRSRIKESGKARLSVHRSPRHIYAQVMTADGSKVLVSASTLLSDIKSSVKNCGNIEAASVVGKTIAERAVEAGIKEVAFDRSGYKYHGRVKALADAARENGLEF